MDLKDFDFELPDELIAQYPSDRRGKSRLLILRRDTGEISHTSIDNIFKWLNPNTLIVLNNTKVRKARLYGKKLHKKNERVNVPETSEKGMEKGTEFLLTEKLSANEWKALARRAKRQHIGDAYHFPGDIIGRIKGEVSNEKIIQFSGTVNDEYLEKYGHTPLPPYIKRDDISEDEIRYQTVYAKMYGAVAAPTAGLHFTWEILDHLKETGHEIAYLTLHVGIGTFTPIRTEKIEDHRMHREYFHIPEETAVSIMRALKEGRDILAVGTTVVRALESAWVNGSLRAGEMETEIFIYPGFKFNVVKRLLTNFHTPKSSLLVLVSAFAGRKLILKAYREAIEKRYRFFSYGDAMLIL